MEIVIYLVNFESLNSFSRYKLKYNVNNNLIEDEQNNSFINLTIEVSLFLFLSTGFFFSFFLLILSALKFLYVTIFFNSFLSEISSKKSTINLILSFNNFSFFIFKSLFNSYISYISK